MSNNRKINMAGLAGNPKVISGIIISLAGIYWAFKDFNFFDFKRSIQQIDLVYLILAAIFLWGSVWVRGLRWKWLFKESASPSVSSLYKAELIGYFGNNVLPLRLGEILRAYIIGKENNLSKSFVFGTVVLERLMDMLALTFFAIILLLIYPFEEGWVSNFILKGGVVLSVLIFSLIIISRIKIKSTENKLLRILNQMMEGLQSIKKHRIVPVVIASILIWSIYLLDVYFIQRAFQFNLSWTQSLTVLVISSLVLSIPSAPGMIGTFHAAVKYTMVDIFAFTPNDGNSFAILMHAYGYILFTILGAYYFLKSQFHEQAIKNVLKADSNELQEK
ncbi:MAG: flippase-like domain-containing protein [Candidatus Marinimicrobia bacterium]|nr:flippase-like domain-containing protein [Candidatus Neomarinimicrobiota bacterium]